MFLIRKFSAERFERINSLIDEHEYLLTNTINLIASASYPFPEVLHAMTLPMSIIPTEGLVGNRYFPGSRVIDQVEEQAQERIRELFKSSNEYMATIQPHSGTQANQIVFNAALEPDDVVLSLKPSHGGHVSHTVLVGRRNRVIYYGVRPGHGIDYQQVEDLVSAHRPRLIIAGASSYPLEIEYERLCSVAAGTGALVHADISHTALFVAAGIHRSVFPGVDFATFNMSKNLRGPAGGVLIYRSSLRDRVHRSIFPGTQGGPLENVMFAKLTALDMLTGVDLACYAEAIIRNARALAAGIRDTGCTLSWERTDTHMVLVDVRDLGVTGLEAERVLELHRVLANRNQIPNDPHPAHIASGLRLGSACITTLQYSEEEAYDLGVAIAKILQRRYDVAGGVVDRLLRKYHSSLSTSNVET